MGTPTSAPETITAVALRSACFHALGTSGAAPTKSMISSRAATSRGAAMLLASGRKISAEPNPENPRAVPDTKAIAQMAMAAARLISVGMRPTRLMPASSAQHAAGFLGHLGHDLRRHRVDLLIGQGFLARLDRHRDSDGLFGLIDALAFIDIEHRDFRDQLLVDALRRADDVAGLDGALHDKGKIARHRLERRQLKHRLGAGRLLLGGGDAIEDQFEGDHRAVGGELLKHAWMQFAEITQYVLRTDLDGAGTSGMQPARSARHHLQR